MLKALVGLTLSLAMAQSAIAQTHHGGGSGTLTAKDRADIKVLNGRYSLALGMCDVETWPQLFVAPDGYFASGSRGRVLGQHRLGEMIRSYNCVYENGVAPPHAPGVSVPYKIELTPSPGGATGFAYYNGGRYEDVYVKTPQGWRFKSRTVVTNREQSAKMSAVEFDAIQDLAAKNGGPYADVYEPIPGGTRFKSTAVSIEAKPDGITGKAYLPNNSGHYDDVYEKTAAGWRFKSRTYAPPDQTTTTK